jgi:hypothetical protein
VSFLVNDLSLSGQFHDLDSFRSAVEEIMEIRREIERLGSSLYCHRNLADSQVTSEHVMQRAVQILSPPKRRAWMLWLTKCGPFWEDDQLHNSEETWLEVNNKLVTGTAVGEAAVGCSRGWPRRLISFRPSEWLRDPIDVTWVHNDGIAEIVSVRNHWEVASVQAWLKANPVRLASWQDLAMQMRQACTRLTFATDTFEPLKGHPFAPNAAERIRELLFVLDMLKGGFDEDGRQNAEGRRLYAEYFTGARPRFTDSSDTEKNEWRKDMTFPHPEKRGQDLFCSWHEKVRSPQLRIHFSWPIRPDEPLYVMYVGPKITKR